MQPIEEFGFAHLTRTDGSCFVLYDQSCIGGDSFGGRSRCLGSRSVDDSLQPLFTAWGWRGRRRATVDGGSIGDLFSEAFRFMLQGIIGQPNFELALNPTGSALTLLHNVSQFVSEEALA